MTGAFGSSDKEFNLDMKITKFLLHLYIFFQIPRPGLSGTKLSMFVSSDCYLDMFISQFQIWLELPLLKMELIFS